MYSCFLVFMQTYAVVWKNAGPLSIHPSSIQLTPGLVHLGDPHGDGWNEGGDTGDDDTDLDNPDAGLRLVVVSQREFQRQQTVEVDEDEVVDGGAENHNLHGGHHVTHQRTEHPPERRNSTFNSRPTCLSLPFDHERVDGDHEANNQIYPSQRDYHPA